MFWLVQADSDESYMSWESRSRIARKRVVFLFGTFSACQGFRPLGQPNKTGPGGPQAAGSPGPIVVGSFSAVWAFRPLKSRP